MMKEIALTFLGLSAARFLLFDYLKSEPEKADTRIEKLERFPRETKSVEF